MWTRRATRVLMLVLRARITAIAPKRTGCPLAGGTLLAFVGTRESVTIRVLSAVTEWTKVDASRATTRYEAMQAQVSAARGFESLRHLAFEEGSHIRLLTRSANEL